MQPRTAPITDDVSPALEISRLSSDRDECLAVALHSASLLFRNCVYPLRAAQERIATANNETTTFESVARLRVKKSPFANVLFQRNLLGSGPSFMDSSNCSSAEETRDASARRQAPEPEPARNVRSAAVKGVRSNVCMCADSLGCPILTASPADSFTKTIHFPLDWQAQLDLDFARRPHPSDAHRLDQDRHDGQRYCKSSCTPRFHPLAVGVLVLFFLFRQPTYCHGDVIQAKKRCSSSFHTATSQHGDYQRNNGAVLPKSMQQATAAKKQKKLIVKVGTAKQRESWLLPWRMMMTMVLLLAIGILQIDVAAAACGDEAGDVALTQSYYADIVAGTKSEADVTCIPASAFFEYENDVKLGAMPLLVDIGERAFCTMRGILKFEVGNSCKKLASIGDRAFDRINYRQHYTATVVSFGELPSLESIGQSAFYSLPSGSLQFNAGDSCTQLKTIGDAAFGTEGANGNFNSAMHKKEVIFGALPQLQSLGDWAFTRGGGVISLGAMPKITSLGESTFHVFAGVLTLEAGDVPLLSSFGNDYRAFAEMPNVKSVISFGAMPQLSKFGGTSRAGSYKCEGCTFYQFQGKLIIEAGDLPLLTSIGEMGLYGRAGSSISLGAMPKLESITASAVLQGTSGRLTIMAGDVPLLNRISRSAFEACGNYDSSISFGTMPKIVAIEDSAFANFRGQLTLEAGYTPQLTNIGKSAFRSAGGLTYNSAVSFSGTATLTEIGEYAFDSFKGQITIVGGSSPKLERISNSAFGHAANSNYVGNSKSSLSFTNLKLLSFIGSSAFDDFIGIIELGSPREESFPALLTDSASVATDAFDGTNNTKSIIYLSEEAAVPKLERALLLPNSYGGTINYQNNRRTGCGSNGSDVPLNKEFYNKILAGEASERTVTCIPSFAFFHHDQDVVLQNLSSLVFIEAEAFTNMQADLTMGSMPALVSIGRQAFAGASGTVTFAAGECQKLLLIGDFAFHGVANMKSFVSFGATPALEMIGTRAFEGFKGLLTASFGEMRALTNFPIGVFQSISNTTSAITIGSLPALSKVAASAFHEFAGTLTIVAGDCPKLSTIESSAFQGVSYPQSSVVFGATPALTSIGSSAFKAMKGKLTFAAGDVPALTKFGSSAFAAVTNIESTITFTNLRALETIEATAFTNYAGKMVLSGTPGFPGLASVAPFAFDGTSNPASTIILPAADNPKSKLFIDALADLFYGTIIHRADPGSPCDQTTSAGTWGKCTAVRRACPVGPTGAATISPLHRLMRQKHSVVHGQKTCWNYRNLLCLLTR